MIKRILAISLAIVAIGCNNAKKEQKDSSSSTTTKEAGSIFLSEFDTPYGTPPFDKITEDDYLPAFEKGMEEHNKEIEAIASNPEKPTFENTIGALDRSGEILSRVSGVFWAVLSTDKTDNLSKISEVISPKLSEHSGKINLNEKLFARIKELYDNKANLGLTVEQTRLLDNYYNGFVRGGIMLSAQQKEEVLAIDKELSELTLKFGNNLLAETNNYKLVIDKKEDLAGLPQGVIDAAADEAKSAGEEGKWVFTLQKPSWIPFLQYSDKRDLREKLYKAMYNRGNNGNEYDNKEIINKIVNLRIKRAKMFGYKNHADYVLEEAMAKNGDNATKLLTDVWKYALPQAKKELAELQKLADKEGAKIKIESWDWWYYTEKLRKAKFDLDEEQTKPYFKMENVRQGMFDTASRLFDIKIEKITDVAVYNPEVETYKITDNKGNLVCILYTDFYPRASKSGGAWMGVFREQYNYNGKDTRPLVYNVGNFTKPTSNQPSLLTLDDVSTMFHEFGHSLHGMFASQHYKGVSGTNVSRDYVELPSQINELWAFNPEVLKTYAKHYQTGEVIPDALIKKIQDSGNFNQGFSTVENVAASMLDMAWHTQTEEKKFDVNAFEEEQMKKIGLINEIIPRYKSTYFAHIFDGGYSAGYYGYMWSDVLVNDAFQEFKENGIFDKKTAESFKENILTKGNSDDPMNLYKKFRGQEPDVKYLLKSRGFIK